MNRFGKTIWFLGGTMLLVLLVGVPGRALATGTPAGTEIKNQATATYRDAGGNLQTATSNDAIRPPEGQGGGFSSLLPSFLKGSDRN